MPNRDDQLHKLRKNQSTEGNETRNKSPCEQLKMPTTEVCIGFSEAENPIERLARNAKNTGGKENTSSNPRESNYKRDKQQPKHTINNSGGSDSGGESNRLINNNSDTNDSIINPISKNSEYKLSNYRLVDSNSNINFLQINLQKSRSATQNLKNTVDQTETDIIFIQEPYTIKNKINYPNIWKTFYDQLADPPRAAIVCTNKNWNPTTLHTSKDIIAVELNLINQSYIFISVYADGLQEIECTIDTLEQLKSNYRGKAIVIAGDFNSWNTKWGYPANNTRGHKMAEFIETNDLILFNTDDDPPTFETNYSKGWPDLTMATLNIASQISNWHINDIPSCSDHNNITFELSTDSKTLINTRYNTNCRKNHFIKNLKETTKETEKHIAECNNVKDLELYSEFLIDVIKDTCDKTFKIKSNKRDKKTCWWNPKLSEQKSKTRALRRRLKKESNAELRLSLALKYKKESANLKKLILDAKHKSWGDFCTKNTKQYGVLHKLITNKTFTPTKLTALKNQSGNQDTYTILNTILDAIFPTDSTDNDSDYHRTIRNQNSHINTMDDIPFTKKEIDNIIHYLKRHKAPGPDSIDNQVIKYINYARPNLFKTWFNKCLEMHCFPEVFKRGQIVLFNKQGKDPEDPSNYRPISLLPSIGKVLEKLLINRLRHSNIKLMKDHSQQYGFKNNTSTEHAISDVINHIKSNQKSKHTILITLDLKGAFDSLWWPQIRKSLVKADCPSNIFYTMKHYLENRSIQVKYDGGIINRPVDRGCPQGSCGGPALWNLCFNDILNAQWPSHTTVRAFADDVSMIVEANTIADLKKFATLSLDQFSDECDKQKLLIAHHKSNAIFFKKDKPVASNPIIKCKGITIKQVKEVKYLGVIIDKKLSWLPHIRYLKNKTNTIFNQLRRTTGNNWGLNSNFLKILYNTVIVPIVCHAAACWSLPERYIKTRSLLSLQRGFALTIARAYKTTATAAVLTISGLVPLNIKVVEEANRALVGRMGISSTCEGIDFNSSDYETKQCFLDSHPATTGKGVQIDFKEHFEHPHHVIYTDGSKINDKVGAAFVAYGNGIEIHSWQGHLSQGNSVFQAELVAINEAVKYTIETLHQKTTINSDSQSALKAIADPQHSSPIVKSIQRTLQESCKTHRIVFKWVKAHINIKGNERADELAKEAAQNSMNHKINIKLPRSHLIRNLKQISSARWQEYWDTAPHGRRTYEFIKKVDVNFNLGDNRLTQYLTEHGPCPVFFKKRHLANTEYCTCGEVGNMDHYAYSCGLTSRFHLKNPGPNLSEHRRLFLDHSGMKNSVRKIIDFLQSRGTELCQPAP